MNRTVLVGRLTKEPDLRFTPAGKAVCTFTLAVNRPFKNQNGEQDADFISIVVWNRQAENAANFLKKGSLVGIDGRIQTRNYQNSEGKRVYITEVVAESVQFLEPKNQTSQNVGKNGNYTSQNNSDNANQDPFSNSGQIDIDDSDLPF